MNLNDHLWLSFSNLWQNKLRTSLTTIGVIVGIGALVSMVSFGIGMQRNISDSLKANNLFTSMYITPKKINVNEVMSGDVSSITDAMQEGITVALDDSALQTIMNIPEVEIAYPEMTIPVKVIFNNEEQNTQLQAMPPVMGNHAPFNKLMAGEFFESEDENSVVISTELLSRLKVKLKPKDQKKAKTIADSLMKIGQVNIEDLIGQEILLVSSTLDIEKIASNPFMAMMNPSNLPVRDDTTRLTICGVRENVSSFEMQQYKNLIAPIKTVQKIPHLGFSSVWDLLNRDKKGSGFSSVYVRVKKIKDLEPVQKAIETMGFGVLSVASQFEEIKKGFLIMDAMLGAIGTIALFVAALGIANTLVMSILERTREIGIMKAIGGSEGEIKSIFLVEASVIGFWGGVFGVILGWIVTRIANLVGNYYIVEAGGPRTNLFYIPFWLIASGILFSILISILAGLYPAMRAARVDPVHALRHD